MKGNFCLCELESTIFNCFVCVCVCLIHCYIINIVDKFFLLGLTIQLKLSYIVWTHHEKHWLGSYWSATCCCGSRELTNETEELVSSTYTHWNRLIQSRWWWRGAQYGELNPGHILLHPKSLFWSLLYLFVFLNLFWNLFFWTSLAS